MDQVAAHASEHAGGAERKRKTEAELQRDADAIGETPPPPNMCCGGDSRTGSAEMNIALAPVAQVES